MIDLGPYGTWHSPPASSSYQEGDRCTRCRYWWWADAAWHSLVPRTYHGTPELAADCLCPQCAEAE